MSTFGTGNFGTGTFGDPSPPVIRRRPTTWFDGRIEIDMRARGAASIWTDPPAGSWRRIDHRNKLRRLSIRRRGAKNIWTPPEPSDATLLLGNNNGWLDPSNAGGPYAAALYRQVQVRGLHCPNMLSDDEWNFEDGLGSWKARAGAALSPSTDPAGVIFGRRALAITWNGALGGSALVDLGERQAVTPGIVYWANAYFTARAGNPGAGSPFCRILIDWFDAAGVLLSTVAGADVDDAATAEAQAGGIAAPATAATARVVLQVSDLSAGDVHLVDDVNFGRRFPLFHGLAKRWPVRWAKGALDATTEILVEDRLRPLADGRTPPSVVEYELHRGARYPRPAHLYVFREESAGPDVEYQDEIGSVRGESLGAPAKSVGENLVPYGPAGGLETANAPRFEGGIVGFPTTLLPALSAAANFTVMAITRLDPEHGCYVLNDSSVINPRLQLGIRQPGYASGRFVAYARMLDAGVADAVFGPDTDAARLDDGDPHMIWATYHTDDRLYLYWDKTQGGSVLVGAPDPAQVGYYTNLGYGSLGMLATWNQTVFDADKSRIYDDVFTPWAGDGSEARLTKLLAMVAPGVPFSQGASSVGTLLPALLGARPPLKIIGALMIDHADRFFANLAGRLTVITSGNLPPVLRTYGTGGVPILDLDFSEQATPYGFVRYRNEAGQETRVGDVAKGAELTIEDSAAKPQFLSGNAQRLLDAAAAEAVPGPSTIWLDPDSAGWVETLSLDLYDRFNVAYELPWVAGVVTKLREAYWIEHDFSPGPGWTTMVRARAPID